MWQSSGSHLQQPARNLIEQLGARCRINAQLRCRLVDQIDGLVGKEAVGDVTVGEGSGGDEGTVRDGDSVMELVPVNEKRWEGGRE